MTDSVEPMRGQNEDTLLIRNTEIRVVSTSLRQDSLQFFVDNPRVYSVLRKDENSEPSQLEIQTRLLKMDHVKELIQDIKLNGGLTDPIIVRGGTLEVLEGNSRLAAYRHLVQLDPIKWGMIKVRLLPEDIDDSLVLALLGQYHLKGKTPWPPFEKAGFLYRRHKTHNISIPELAIEVGETRQKVAHMVAVYQFMIENKQKEQTRWSYYDEYLKSKYIKKVRSKELDQIVVKKVNTGEIERAVDMRGMLPVICKAKKAFKGFIRAKYDFEEAYGVAVKAGADSTPYSKLARFRKWLATQDAEQALSRTGGETRRKVEFELKKLGPVVERLLRKLSS